MQEHTYNTNLHVISALIIAFLLHISVFLVFVFFPTLHKVTNDGGSFITKNKGEEIKSIMVVANFPLGELKKTQINQIKSKPKQNKKVKVLKDEEKNIKTYEIKSPIKVKKKKIKKHKKEYKKKKKENIEKIEKKSKNSEVIKKKLSHQNSLATSASMPLVKNNNSLQSPSSGYTNSQKVNWKGLVMAHLAKYKKYPNEALMQKREGISVVEVILDKKGMLVAAKIRKSSGHKKLDNASLSLLQRASPLPQPPSFFFKNKNTIKFPLPIRYNIKEFLKSRF